MTSSPVILPLAAAGLCSALAGLAHLACIVLGAPAYRVMGAGERMVRAAQAGRPSAALLTAGIAAMLIAWALLAWSAGGLLPAGQALPGLPVLLAFVTAVYLLRAVATPWLRPRFPDNSPRFWQVSGTLCALIGGLHAWGWALAFG